ISRDYLSTVASHPSSTPLVFDSTPAPPSTHSFPTRRSSDLVPVPLRTHPHGPRAQLLDRRRDRAPARHPPLARDHVADRVVAHRSEEHTSELQSRGHLVCRLLLEKKKTKTHHIRH